MAVHRLTRSLSHTLARSRLRAPARALAWEFYHRHRWGFIAISTYVLGLAVVQFLILAPGHVVDVESSERFAFGVIVPLGISAFYLLGVFTFGFTGDLAGRESMFPP